MNEPMEKEELLKEYFNTPVAAPPHLVASTLRIISDRPPVGFLMSAAVLNLFVVMLLVFFLLAGPLILFWKIVMLLVFALFQAVAAVLLVYNISASCLKTSAD